MALIKLDQKTFANVLGDGKIRIASTEVNPNAVRRDYETSDGNKGTKYELVYDKIVGKIKNIFIYEGDYGKSLKITLSDEGSEDVVLCLSMQSNFSDDFMKKLPNIDLSQPLEFSPYSFENDKGKTLKGITLTQNDVKIDNFFYDKTLKENINGYPNPEFKKNKKTGEVKPFDSDDWKIYFISARKFLEEYMTDNILPKMPRMSDIDPSMTEDEMNSSIDSLDFTK